MSLADEIAKLTNPAPELRDPEDEVNLESIARLSERFDENEGFESGHEVSSLRSKNAPLLDELDNRYAGKRISRKTLDPVFDKSDNSEDDEDEEEEDEIDDDAVAIFRRKLAKSSANQEREMSSDSHSESGSPQDDSEDDGSDEQEEEDDDADEQDEVDDDEQDEEDYGSDDIVQRFSNIDVTEEIEKGKTVQRQQDLWNKLCECRIKLQKLLLLANEFPQHDQWNNFKEKSCEPYSEDLIKGCKYVGKLLSNLIELEEELSKSNCELTNAKQSESTNIVDDDEEIPSDSDVDDGKDGAGIDNKLTQPLTSKPTKIKSKKRKMNFDDYEECLSNRHKIFVPARNAIIQKWDDKTSLTTGRRTQKSFNAFDQSAVKQINQILMDKPRLIRRTQLKRSAYRVLGKQDPAESTQEIEHDEHLKNYDPEIFDDDDFYRQLLKDIIETKSIGMDPMVLSKQLEIQRIRSKMKRKVDTRASKGRKIRYNVHPKMVNFMAPVNTVTMTNDARDELFKSLFGQNLPMSAV